MTLNNLTHATLTPLMPAFKRNFMRDFMRIVIAALLILPGASAMAQAVQHGIVLEYRNGEKTPLEGVSIAVANAVTVMSAADGTFTLNFRTLHYGDNIQFRRIEKAGYEVFNKEAIEVMRIGRSADDQPIQIIMCSVAALSELRDSYRNAATGNYQRQYEEEHARLEAERRANRLKEEDYQTQINQLEELYEQQLDNIESYIDHFSRIDLGSVSGQERHIVQLVQMGRFDEAVAKYESMHCEEQFENASANRLKAAAALHQLQQALAQATLSEDSLYSIICRKNDALRMAGGQKNLRRVGESLRRMADADTTSHTLAKEYANYLKRQNRPSEAIKYYRRGIRHSKMQQDWSEAAQCSHGLFSVLFALRQYDAAIECEANAIQILFDHPYENADQQNEQLATLHASLCMLYSQTKRYDEALQQLNAQDACLNSITEPSDPLRLVYNRSISHYNRAYIYYGQQKMQKALDEAVESADMIEECSTEDPQSYASDYLKVLSLIGNIHTTMGNKKEALSLYIKLHTKTQEAYDRNPDAMLPFFSRVSHRLAMTYISLGDKDRAQDVVKAALKLDPNNPALRQLSY